MLEPLKKSFLAGLGVVAFTKERLERVIQELVDRGELTRDQALSVSRHLLQRGSVHGRDLAKKLYREFERLLGHGPLATISALQSLEERVRGLEQSLDDLAASQAGSEESGAGDAPR